MKTRLPFFCAAAVALLAVSARAEVRTFTDSASGRTLSAEVMSASAESVTLKLSTGATHTLPLNRLSDADRNYVTGWVAKNPNATAPAAARLLPARSATPST